MGASQKQSKESTEFLCCGSFVPRCSLFLVLRQSHHFLPGVSACLDKAARPLGVGNMQHLLACSLLFPPVKVQVVENIGIITLAGVKYNVHVYLQCLKRTHITKRILS